MDLYIAGSLNPESAAKQVVTPGFGTMSKFCAGIEKLIQRFMITFLTAKGSQPNFPDFGSDFSNYVRVGRNITPDKLAHRINFALADTILQLRVTQAESTTIPLDEQLRDARMVELLVSGDTVKVKIQIYSNAGDSIQFLMPLPV